MVIPVTVVLVQCNLSNHGHTTLTAVTIFAANLQYVAFLAVLTSRGYTGHGHVSHDYTHSHEYPRPY